MVKKVNKKSCWWPYCMFLNCCIFLFLFEIVFKLLQDKQEDTFKLFGELCIACRVICMNFKYICVLYRQDGVTLLC